MFEEPDTLITAPFDYSDFADVTVLKDNLFVCASSIYCNRSFPVDTFASFSVRSALDVDDNRSIP